MSRPAKLMGTDVTDGEMNVIVELQHCGEACGLHCPGGQMCEIGNGRDHGRGCGRV